MYQVIIVLHVLVGLGVIGLILIQHGKGADAGAAFGSGSSGTVFGAQGSASFLSRTTAVLAAVFFSTSLALAILSGGLGENTDIMDVEIPVAEQLDMELPVIDGQVPAIRTPTTIGEELPQIEGQVEVIKETLVETPNGVVEVIEDVTDTVIETQDGTVEVIEKTTAIVEEGLPQIIDDEVIVIDEVVTP
ncbi:MAG: preprotein translocase subunit SecG [Methyloprofundus sp.]|nr:preprotein translocase subunit SecG [Methyloprofundus sp.]